MKRIILFLSLIAVTYASYSQHCPTSMRRNNGDGTCNQTGQLILNYNICPNTADIIDSVYINGTKYEVVFGPPSACAGPQNSVKYCILSGNTPPTGFWTIYFHNDVVPEGWDCIVDGGPLPVNLTTFNAKRSSKNVLISWYTAYEQNVLRFEIQRMNGNDFETIGSVDAANLPEGKSYSFTDVSNKNRGMSQYRLKMIDKDGNYKNSEIRVVRGMAASSDFVIFPNPTRSGSKVTISDVDQATELQVVDESGKMIRVIPMKNSNTITIDNLEKGTYMIRVYNSNTGESTTKKLTVMH
jgi:hypothetical protein